MSVLLKSPHGPVVSVSEDKAAGLLNAGYKPFEAPQPVDLTPPKRRRSRKADEV